MKGIIAIVLAACMIIAVECASHKPTAAELNGTWSGHCSVMYALKVDPLTGNPTGNYTVPPQVLRFMYTTSYVAPLDGASFNTYYWTSGSDMYVDDANWFRVLPDAWNEKALLDPVTKNLDFGTAGCASYSLDTATGALTEVALLDVDGDSLSVSTVCPTTEEIAAAPVGDAINNVWSYKCTTYKVITSIPTSDTSSAVSMFGIGAVLALVALMF